MRKNWPHPDDKPFSRLEMAIVGVLVLVSVILAIWGLAMQIRSWL